MEHAFDIAAQSPWLTKPCTPSPRRATGATQLELEFTGASPIVKWPGGKSRLLSQLWPLLPPHACTRRYIEPFAGGAAMYFRLRPERAVLADINAQLVATYRCVQETVEPLCRALRTLERSHSLEQYYAVRKRYNDTTPDSGLSRCADFIYLNKTCFNGLHRVNRRGQFNAPAGRYAAPRVVDALRLHAASYALRTAHLMCGSFDEVLQMARAGDFVYLDPPYDVESDACGFTAYAAAPFGPSAQDALASVFQALDRRGCKLLLSNSATAANRARYAGYEITEVVAPRSISRRADQRRAVAELAVRNYS